MRVRRHRDHRGRRLAGRHAHGETASVGGQMIKLFHVMASDRDMPQRGAPVNRMG